MPVNNGVISAPVSVDDVHDVLGESSYDIGTLCMSSKINKYAKFKPVIIDQPKDITDTQRENVNFGLSFAIYTTKAALVTALKNNYGNEWTYIRVTATDWKRLTDFDGYDHNAVSPFGTINGGSYLKSNGPIITCTLPISGTGSLQLGDFNKNMQSSVPLSEWYFGIMLYNDKKMWLATGETKLSGTGDPWQVNFYDAIGLTVGYYTAVPFLCDKRWILGQSDPTGFHACVVPSGAKSIHIINTRFPTTIKAHWNSGKTAAIYKITISATGLPGSLTNVQLWAAMDGGTNSKFVKQLGNTGTITVARPYTTSGTVSVQEPYVLLGIKYDGLSEIEWFGIFENISEVPDYGGGTGGDYEVMPG